MTYYDGSFIAGTVGKTLYGQRKKKIKKVIDNVTLDGWSGFAEIGMITEQGYKKNFFLFGKIMNALPVNENIKKRGFYNGYGQGIMG